MPQPSRSFTLARRAVLVAVLAGVSACAAEPSAIKPGVCVVAETHDVGNRVPDLSTVSRCTTPHRYEVYDIIDLPSAVLTPSDRPAWMDVRDDLARPSTSAENTPHRRAFDKYAAQRCLRSLLRETGYDALTVNGRSAAAVGLIPAMRGVTHRYTVMPADQWRAGRRQALCSARMSVPVQAQAYALSNREVLLLSTAKTAQFPIALRSCRAYDRDRRNVAEVSCARRHISELLFTFDARQALGTRFARSIVAKPTPAKFDRLDQVCTKTLPQLLGRNYDKKDLRGFGSVAQRWTATSTPVRCDIGPKDFRTFDLPPGSLVGTDGVDVKLVPVDA